MAIGGINVGQELLNVPMGTMICEMAKAIAQGQWELDKSSMTVAELMSGQRLLRDLETGKLINPTERGEPQIVDSRVYFGYTYEKATDGNNKPVEGQWQRVANKVSMMELGFTPTFYQFVDTIIEVKIAIKITGSEETARSSTEGKNQASDQARTDHHYGGTSYWGRWGYGHDTGTSSSSHKTVQTTQVDASYANKYSYSVDSASMLRTKLCPVPPPAVLLERIHEVMQIEREFQARIANNEVKKLNGVDPKPKS